MHVHAGGMYFVVILQSEKRKQFLIRNNEYQYICHIN